MSSERGRPLSEFVTLKRGSTYKSSLLNQEGPVLLGLSSIAPNGGFRRGSLKTYGGESPAEITLRPGDLYVSLKDVTQSGDLLGAVARVPQDVITGRLTQDTVTLIVNDGAAGDADYIYWLLRTPAYREYCRAHAIGVTTLALPRNDFLAFRVPPKTPARAALVTALRALDDKIEHDQALGRRLLDVAAIAVDQMLRDCDGTQSIYEFASVTYGAAFKSALFADAGVSVLRIRDLTTHLPSVRTTEHHPKARVVVGGDVVVGMDGEFRAHLWHGPDSLLNQRVCVFDPLRGVSRAFVWRAIQRPLAFIEATESGTTVIHLGKADIDEFELPAPSHEQMRHLVEHVDPLVALNVQLGRQLQRLKELRNALLPKLVSGAIRVPDSYDPGDAFGVAEAAGVTVP